MYKVRIKKVNCAGLEPATSALSRQRSEPTELTIPNGLQIYNKVFKLTNSYVFS